VEATISYKICSSLKINSSLFRKIASSALERAFENVTNYGAGLRMADGDGLFIIKGVLMTKNGPINFVHNFFPNSP